MKANTIILFVLLVASTFGQSQPVELQKIDKRLEELKLIWRQEQDVINGFTKNRTVPVKEGSKAYFACLEASKRIKLAEDEAAKLKRQRAILAKEPTGDSSKEKQAPETTETLREFDFTTIKSKGDPKKETTLSFKGFYLDMPAADALGLLNHYLGLPQVNAEPTQTTEEQLALAKRGEFAKIAEAIKSEMHGKTITPESPKPYKIIKFGNRAVIAQYPDVDAPFAVLDEDLKVNQFSISSSIRETLFDAKNTPLEEFIETFEEAYGISSFEEKTQTIKSLDEPLGQQEFHIHRSPKGYEAIIWGEKTIFGELSEDDVFMSQGQGSAEGRLDIRKIETEAERKSKFD